MTASLSIRVIRSSLVDWRSMKKSADMRGTAVEVDWSIEQKKERTIGL